MGDVSVNYVSAQPGTGKTRAAIELMRRCITQGYAGKKVGYIFYVAPTIELLLQTINNLEKVLERKEHLCEMAHLVVGDSSKSRPSKAGDYTEIKVQRVLDGQAQGKEEAVPFIQGSILFLTHATFLKLQSHAKFKNTTVIFDESRKWATMPCSIELTPSVEKLFDQLFTTTPLTVAGTVYDYIHCLHARPDVQANHTAKLIEGHEQGEEYKPLRRLWSQLLPKEGKPVRMQVFILRQGKGDKKQIIQITLPSNPFVGFKRVFVLSAAFTSSEMYHLMLMEGCTLVDSTEDFMDRFLGENEHMRAKGIMLQRNACLYLSPLADYNSAPSKSKLDSGLLIKKEYINEFRDKMDALGLTSEDLYTVVSHIRKIIRGRLTPNQKELRKFMQEIGCQTDILKWQIEQSQVLAKEWMGKRDPTIPGVMFVNSDRTKALAGMDAATFKFMSTGEAEGRNEFQAANVVCFLAAINPNPMLGRVLNALLKHQGYDSDEDFVVDKAIQCIGRGNIRSHKKADRIKKMLAIVPSQWLAERIYARLNEAPIIRYKDIEKLGNYTIWNGNKKRKAEEVASDPKKVLIQVRQQNKARVDKHLENPINRQLSNLRSLRTRWSKKEQTVEVQKKLKQLQNDIDILVTQRIAHQIAAGTYPVLTIKRPSHP
jgi:hypothetical protein